MKGKRDGKQEGKAREGRENRFSCFKNQVSPFFTSVFKLKEPLPIGIREGCEKKGTVDMPLRASFVIATHIPSWAFWGMSEDLLTSLTLAPNARSGLNPGTKEGGTAVSMGRVSP